METNIQEKLKALFEGYAHSLPDKLMAIKNNWLALTKQWDDAKFRELHRQVHSLCGSSGTYGYKILSHSARELEMYLKLLIGAVSLSAEQTEKINQLLTSLISTPLTVEEPQILTERQAALKTKIVYILDLDKEFAQEVKLNLDAMNYMTDVFQNFADLRNAIERALPAAIILDESCLLAEEDAHYLQELQQRESRIPLFCTSENNDLKTRLRMIRVGSSGYFHKPIETYYLTKALDQACNTVLNTPIRVLIIDDSQSLADYHALILQKAGMEVRTLTNPMHVLDVLADFRPNLVLLDVYMPECSGLEVAAVLRQESLYAGIPIIFLSTEEDRFKQLSALSLGGDDFLTKPIKPEHLVAAVRMRAERANVLSSFMMKDSLTGLLNHTNILQHLDIEVMRAERVKSPLSFMMIDIDYFKSVNDEYGHPIGDDVLRKLSELLVTRLRRTDLVGRYGGEEFAVILPNIDAEECATLCKAIREKFSQFVFRANGHLFKVTFSAGIASCPAIHNAKNLIDAADQALYIAKNHGRNCEMIYKPHTFTG